MCGIFGFTGGSPDHTILRAIAEGASRRGADGYGFGWISEGIYHTHRERVSLHGRLKELERLHTATAAIGHARLATLGGSEDLRDFHPFQIGVSTLLVHNGNIYNFRELRTAYGLNPSSNCDSEILALLIAAQNGNAAGKLKRALSLIRTPAYAVACIVDGSLAIARRRLPLWIGNAGGVSYFSSARFMVHKNDALLLPENTVYGLTYEGGRVISEIVTVKHLDQAAPETSPPTLSAWQRLEQPKGQS